MARVVQDYPCPTCGHTGSHPVMAYASQSVTVWCGSGDCTASFTIPLEVA